MRELTLERVARGRYAFGDLGTLLELRMYASEIQAGGVSWTLRRAAAGLGQTIRATERVTGRRVCAYVPKGLLHLRGIYGGTLALDARRLEWRANHRFGSQFALLEDVRVLARFRAGSPHAPVCASVEDADLEPLLLLFCCHLVKQVVDTARASQIAVASSSALGA